MSNLGRKPKDPNRVSRAVRIQEAIKGRLKGESSAEIAKRFGVSQRQIEQDLQEGLNELAAYRLNDVEKFRDMSLAQLDTLQAAIWDRAVNGGDLMALDRVLAIMDKRAKLTGQYIAKVEIKADVTHHEVNVLDQAQMLALLEQFGVIGNVIDAEVLEPQATPELPGPTPGEQWQGQPQTQQTPA